MASIDWRTTTGCLCLDPAIGTAALRSVSFDPEVTSRWASAASVLYRRIHQILCTGVDAESAFPVLLPCLRRNVLMLDGKDEQRTLDRHRDSERKSTHKADGVVDAKPVR